MSQNHYQKKILDANNINIIFIIQQGARVIASTILAHINYFTSIPSVFSSMCRYATIRLSNEYPDTSQIALNIAYR